MESAGAPAAPAILSPLKPSLTGAARAVGSNYAMFRQQVRPPCVLTYLDDTPTYVDFLAFRVTAKRLQVLRRPDGGGRRRGLSERGQRRGGRVARDDDRVRPICRLPRAPRRVD